jgi:hypothetical protein
MKKMLFVLAFAIFLPYATLAHADTVIGGSESAVIGGSESTVIGGSEAAIASWLSAAWHSLVTVIGGSE